VSSHWRKGFLAHVTTWRFVLALAALLGVDYWIEHTTIAKRASLGGFDTASEYVEMLDAKKTAVIGISSIETQKYFAGQRPIPPDSLVSVVSRLLRLKPRALVVDIFTDGAGYVDSVLANDDVLANQHRLVWAQAIDTAPPNEVLPILSGMQNPPGQAGLASILADEDRLVRTFRPRYAGVGTGPAMAHIETLPLQAAKVFTREAHDSVAARRLGDGDTASIALRAYTRDPPFYLLDDLMTALPSLEAKPDSQLAARVWVLGFIDGTDLVLTPRGARAGPEVVADAIETLLDERGVIVKFPWQAELLGKLLLALLVGFIHYRLSRRVAAVSMVGLTFLVFWVGLLMFAKLGYWTNFVLIVVGMWIEQLYESAAHTPAVTVQPEPEVPLATS
jgi:CHASE2 domain-containing sensor protein